MAFAGLWPVKAGAGLGRKLVSHGDGAIPRDARRVGCYDSVR